MRSPQITGDDQPSPGIGACQTTFSVVLHVTGSRGSSSTVDIASAPRKAGQFSDPADSGAVAAARASRTAAKAAKAAKRYRAWRIDSPLMAAVAAAIIRRVGL